MNKEDIDHNRVNKPEWIEIKNNIDNFISFREAIIIIMTITNDKTLTDSEKIEQINELFKTKKFWC